MKIIILVMVALALEGCGKKAQDSGPQFSLDLNASQDSLKDGVITRADENSGPTYSLNSSSLQDIQYLDKKLVCGTFIINAKRTLSTDVGFKTFKLSESEFHGLNQLPKQPKCILQLTAANNLGSTATKNIPISLSFDSGAPIQISRFIAVLGHYVPYYFVGQNQLVVDSYEMNNPLPYDVSLLFYPVLSDKVWGDFFSDTGRTCSHAGVNITIGKILFDPPTEYSGNAFEGFLFKIKAGQSLKLSALGNLPESWLGTRTTRMGTYQLTLLTVSAVAGLAQPSLLQSVDFEIKPHDPQSMEPVSFSRTGPHRYTIAYNAGINPEINGCRQNPDF